MANVGDILVKPEDGWSRFGYSDSRINFYSGSWVDYNDMKYSTTTNASYKFYVYGESFRIIGYKNSDRGDISVSIDGETKNYNAYNGSLLTSVLLFDSGQLSDQIHLVEVKKVTGTYIDIVGIDVIGSCSKITSEQEYLSGLVNMTPVMTSNNTPSPYVISSSTEYSSTYASWKAFNGTDPDPSGWCSSDTDTNKWIMIDFGKTTSVSLLKISSRSNSMYGDSTAPKNFEVLGSDDGVIFNLIKSFSDIKGWGVAGKKEFYLGGKHSYRYFKIKILATNGEAYCGVGELSFLMNVSSNEVSPISRNNASLEYTIPMNTTQKIKAKTKDPRVGLLGLANDGENFGDLYVVGKDGKAHLTKSGIKSEIVFDGAMKASPSKYTLKESISKYNCIIVLSKATDLNNKNVCGVSTIINVVDVVYGESDQFANIANHHSSYGYTMTYSFADDMTLYFSYVEIRGWTTPCIYKIIGVY